MDSTAWDERYAASELVWSAAPNQFVATELEASRPGRALDVAAGEGRNTLWLAEHGWEVTAVDFSLTGLDKGRAMQSAHPHGHDLHIDWVHGDVLTQDFAPAAFDLVLLAYLQLREDERHDAVRRSFQALAVGGTFLLVAHDRTNLAEGTGGPQDAAVLYTAEDVLADLDGERFEVARAERVERVVAAGDDHRGEPDRTAYDALLRLTRTA